MGGTKFQDKTLLLRTGCWYELRVIRLLRIPGDQAYFLCMDMNGLKHLIPASHYSHYSIKTGSSIKCHLDRINCQGRFFFEPAHPFYKAGKSYRFKVIEVNHASHGNRLNRFNLKVADIYGQTLEISVLTGERPFPMNIKFLHCRVTKIKKARLTLEIADKRII